MQSLHDRVVERIVKRFEEDVYPPKDIELYTDYCLNVLASWLEKKAFEAWDCSCGID